MTVSTNNEDVPESGRTLRGVIRNTLIGYALFVLVPLVIGLIASVSDPANSSQRMMYLRDLLWVVILLLTVPLLMGLGILLVQIAVLFGVIRIDVGSVLGEVRGAFQAVSGTARFIGETVATPIIRVWTFFSGGWAFVRELTRLFVAIRRRPDEATSNPEPDESTPTE